MSSTQKIRSIFMRDGHSSTKKLRKAEFEQFLNSLMSGEPFDSEVAGQLWNQASNGNPQAAVQSLIVTIVQAQNIVKNRLTDINDELKLLQQERQNGGGSPYKSRFAKIETQIRQLKQEKDDYEEDLRFLTEPFGLRGQTNYLRDQSSPYETVRGNNVSNLDQKGNEIELKWLFILSLCFGLMQIIVIYKKYDFLNLMVLTCLLFIFLMNHFDGLYIRATMILLIISEVLDMIWLFMNSNEFWNPPSEGVNSSYEINYLRFIIFLTYLGIFLKIPLGVFLYHYRNAEQNKHYDIDIGIAKISLTPNKLNPLSQGMKNIDLLN